jgi:murein DD-endopeptidase MepM/ murein hydrolase activator NlpD
MRLNRYERRRKPRRLPWLGALLLLVLLALAWWRVGPAPEITITPDLPGIGPNTPITVTATEPRRGLGALRVELLYTDQGGEAVAVLAEEAFSPRPFWAFWGARTANWERLLEVGGNTLPGLAGDQATIRVTAERAATWLRHPSPTVAVLELPVRLTPPRLGVVSVGNNVVQAGSGLVVYRVGGPRGEDGVRAGDRWFPGYPLPGGQPGERFALYAAPYDLEDGDRIRLEAWDDLGNFVGSRFVDSFRPRPPAADDIPLSDAFLERVVPPILAATPDLKSTGDPLQDYLQINGALRAENARELDDLATRTAQEFLWDRTFEQLPRSQVMSKFADRRTYLYEGRAVDHQTHLGFDLASTARAPVPSANDGRVVLAKYFGIYGNAVVVDHGFGLMSLYAHLSSLEVQVGDAVRRGQILGRTGATGLAGGDHLHFTMLLHGVAVDPREWWDRRWIRSRIAEPLGSAFPFQD